jgi:xylose isomerase
VRAKAVQFIKEAKDFAQAVGADKVTCCPLGDGYEFAFQYDYAQTWKHLVETFGEAGAYKRTSRCLSSTNPARPGGTASSIRPPRPSACSMTSNTDMGVTLDFGHSMYGNENPAEAVVHAGRKPLQILHPHQRQRWPKWDWDYFCGTKHFLEYVEFIYYLKQYGYTIISPRTPHPPAGTYGVPLRPTAA